MVKGMQENKKEETQNDLVPPVMPSGSNVEVGTEEIKEPKKEKKEKKPKADKKEDTKNVLWAKVLVVLLVAFISIFGVFKLLDFLNKPKTLFYATVESVYSDLNSLMGKLKNDRIYGLLLSNTNEINANLTLNIDNPKRRFEKVSKVLNTMSYSAKIDIDAENKYLGGELSFKSGTDERLKASFIDEDYSRLLNVPGVTNEFLSLDTSRINVEAFNPDKNIFLFDIIKYELLKILEDDQFTSENVAIAVGGKTVDCKKSTYVFEGQELIELVDNIIASIKTNSNVYYYLGDLYGVKASEVDVKLAEFKNSLGIIPSTKYALSSYTKEANDEAVRLELSFYKPLGAGAIETVLGYNRENGYQLLEYKEGSNVESIELKGSIDKSLEATIKDGKNVTTIVYNTDGKNLTGSIQVATEPQHLSVLGGSFSLEIAEEASGTFTLKGDVEFTTYHQEADTKYVIGIDAIWNRNVKINKKTGDGAVKLSTMKKEERDKLLNDFYALIESFDNPEPAVEPME